MYIKPTGFKSDKSLQFEELLEELKGNDLVNLSVGQSKFDDLTGRETINISMDIVIDNEEKLKKLVEIIHVRMHPAVQWSVVQSEKYKQYDEDEDIKEDDDEEDEDCVITRITTEDDKKGIVIVKNNGIVYRAIHETLNERDVLRITNYATSKTIIVDANSYQLDENDERLNEFNSTINYIECDMDCCSDKVNEYIEHYDTAYKQIVCNDCGCVLAYTTGNIIIECECCGTLNKR